MPPNKNSEVATALTALAQSVTNIAESLAKVEQKLDGLQPKIEVPVQQKVQESLPVFNPETYIPAEYRQVVDTVLNKSFGIEIVPLSDSPQFQLIITVPEKYSDISPEYKKTYGSDKRPKVLANSAGVPGVKAWCEMIWGSFNQDRKTQISIDRQQYAVQGA